MSTVFELAVITVNLIPVALEWPTNLQLPSAKWWMESLINPEASKDK